LYRLTVPAVVAHRAESVQEAEAEEKEEVGLIAASCGERLSCNRGVEWHHSRHPALVAYPAFC